MHTWANAYRYVGQTASNDLAATYSAVPLHPSASASQPRPSKKRSLTGSKDEPVTAEARSAQPFARLNLSKNEAQPMIDAQPLAPLPPPPLLPPPPPPLPPGKPAGKTRSSHPMDDAPAAFNVFRKRDFTEVMRADHFEDAAAAQTWIAGMHGKITDLKCLETLEILTSKHYDAVSKVTVTFPSSSMATWHFREYLLCKIDRQSAQERDTSLEASLAQFDEREEHCVQEFWANLDNSSPEIFAQDTVIELLAGKMVVQTLPAEGQSAWRAALGPQTALEFENVLLRALKEGFSTLCSVKKMNINHVAACSKWPLRMYLRLQRQAKYGFEVEEKLQILLKREREELVGVCETLSEFELRCLHALLF